MVMVMLLLPPRAQALGDDAAGAESVGDDIARGRGRIIERDDHIACLVLAGDALGHDTVGVLAISGYVPCLADGHQAAVAAGAAEETAVPQETLHVLGCHGAAAAGAPDALGKDAGLRYSPGL